MEGPASPPPPLSADTLPAPPPRSDAPAWVAAALPLLTTAAWLAWAASALGHAGATSGQAYDLLLYGGALAMVAALGQLGAVIWAAFRGRPGWTVLAAVVGVLLAALLAGGGIAWILDQRDADHQHKRLLVHQRLPEAIRSGDAARIRAAIDALPEQPAPARVMCMLQGGPSYTYVHWLWFDETARGPDLPPEEQLTAVAAVLDGPASREQKQEALRVVLADLIDEPGPALLPRWAALWRRTLAPEAAAAPMLVGGTNEPDGHCSLRDPFARLLSAWGDDGLSAWHQAGLGFDRAQGQHVQALGAVRRASTVQALLAADPQFAAVLREQPRAGEDALFDQAGELSERLDDPAEAGQSLATLEALRDAGARPDPSRASTACERFDASEQRREQAASAASAADAAAVPDAEGGATATAEDRDERTAPETAVADPPHRRKAAQRARALLCAPAPAA